MKLILTITFLFAIFISGCSEGKSVTYSKEDTNHNVFRPQQVNNVYIDYSNLANDAITSIFKKNEIPTRIIVTDFVDITSLDNHSRLGYVLSNNVKNSIINNYATDVIEAEISKYFKISGNGLKILSRDTKKLRSTNFNVRYAVVGTYTYSNKELIIFVKLIDLKTGIIKGSYAKTLPMGEGTKMMLQYK